MENGFIDTNEHTRQTQRWQTKPSESLTARDVKGRTPCFLCRDRMTWSMSASLEGQGGKGVSQSTLARKL